LILIPAIGRSVALLLFLTTEYVRAEGLGSSITDSIPKRVTWIVFVITLSFLLVFKWLGLIAFVCFLGLAFYLRRLFIQRIGGITGDTIGAAIELIETGVLLSFVMASFYI
jgi:adenosylcobinamide-GDP ribazoletransferase